MDNPLTIRPYRPADLGALGDITEACFGEVSIDRNIERLHGGIGGHGWGWRKRRHIEADAAANPGGIFVAEVEVGDPPGATVVGYLTTRVDREGKVGFIPNLAVLPDHRRHGVARRLFAAAFDYLRAEGMEYVRIETLEQNPVGQRFYPQLGFEEVARQIHYGMRL